MVKPTSNALSMVVWLQHFPPASSCRDSYTLLKFYNLSATLVKSVMEVLHPHTSLPRFPSDLQISWHVLD